LTVTTGLLKVTPYLARIAAEKLAADADAHVVKDTTLLKKF